MLLLLILFVEALATNAETRFFGKVPREIQKKRSNEVCSDLDKSL